jgi:hypothetical protein
LSAAAASPFLAKYFIKAHRQMIPRAVKIRAAAGLPNLPVRSGESGKVKTS